MNANFFFIFLILIMLISCFEKSAPKEFKRLKVWEEIQTAVKEERIDYLLEISQDTLDCLGCNEEERIAKEEFFSKYVNQIKRPYSSKYGFHEEEFKDIEGYDKRYRINYFDGGRGDEVSTVIYTILVGKKGVKYLGAFWIP